MANPEHLALFKQGVEAWNQWREADLREGGYLRGADLRRADLRGASLIRANLRRADLREANLRGANLYKADLRGGTTLYEADLSEAYLYRANLEAADLCGADLSKTYLIKANLHGADLRGADLSEAILWNTSFSDVNLTEVEDLDTCRHEGPSTLDFRTLQQSGPLPLAFLRGCGLPDLLIDYLPSLLNQTIQYYSCFISYSSKDEDFAQRLYADLQNSGVRCWFAPKDIQGG